MSFSGLVRQVRRSAKRGSAAHGKRTKKIGVLHEQLRKANAGGRPSVARKSQVGTFCDFRGVRVGWIVEMQRQLESGELARGVELVELLEDFRGKGTFVAKGTTLRISGEAEEDGKLRLFTPHAGCIVVPDSGLRHKDRADWTTEDISEFVVKPTEEVWSEGLLFNQVIEKRHPDAVGRVYQGAFVCHARRSSFRDLVRALEHHLDADSYAWIDVFGATQPVPAGMGGGANDEMRAVEQDLLRRLIGSELHAAVAHFQRFVLVADSWAAPRITQRAWCLWELYGRVTSPEDDAVDVIFPPNLAQQIEHDAMSEGVCGWAAAADGISIRAARCANAEDKFLFDEAIARNVPGGHAAVNFRVAGALRECLARWAVDLVHKGGDREDEGQARLAHDAAMLSLEQGRAELAAELVEESLQLRMRLCGDAHALVAETLQSKAAILSALRRGNQALEALERSLEIQEGLHGKAHASLVGTLVGIGRILKERQQSDAREAAKSFMEQALAIAQRSGERASSLAPLVGLADAFVRLQDFDAALEQYNRALDLSESLFGSDGTEMADIVEKIAMLYFKQSKPEKAIECEEHALAIRVKCLGPDHPKTATSKVFIQRLRDGHKTAKA